MTSIDVEGFGAFAAVNKSSDRVCDVADRRDTQTLGPCSFAIVIQQLPAELRDPVCIFYLVLRALDTVEDDMAIEPSEKLPILHSFHQKIYDRQVPLMQDFSLRQVKAVVVHFTET